MNRRVTHADLVARASGALEGAERDRVDRALATQPALREQFEAVAAHLLIYDEIGEAPPPPPIDGILARIDAAGDADGRVSTRDLPQAVTTSRRWTSSRAATAAFAATLLVALGAIAVALLTSGTRAPSTPVNPSELARLGSGIEVLRAGVPIQRVPAGTTRTVALEAGDVLQSERAAELHLADRAHVILAGESPLAIVDGTTVHLTAGRAIFQIEPGATRFLVTTPHGDVAVLGTRFEVDLRYGALAVHVEEGVVSTGALRLEAGSRLDAEGEISAAEGPAGAWVAEPALELARSGPIEQRVDQPLELRVELSNPHHVGIHAPGPAADRNPLYVVVQRLGADGTWRGNEQPWTVTEENILSGESVVRPGEPVILGGGERRALTLRLLSPFRDPGTYRVRVGYHPSERRPVVSAPLEIEVVR